jgi:HAD superfamily hydrolase (TIGR01509 family)
LTTTRILRQKRKMQEKPPGLVIFDCDGVLVDSEMLSASVLMGLLEEIGMPISFEVFREDFLGRGFTAATRRLKDRTDKIVPPDFKDNYFDRLLRRFEAELEPMHGVEAVLHSLTTRFCLATSSTPQRLACALKSCKLAALFEGRSFTASLVQNAKPAPDLFLHAAEQCGATPADCLVIEDSEMGILAAQAAGMKVWHFAGGAHVKAGYHIAENLVPDRVIADMAELHSAFVEIGVCRNI